MLVKDKIHNAIALLEREQDIHVLYACEAGERAWGFASPGSLYDVRFIFRRRYNSYLSLQEGRETCELDMEDNIQLSGWDIRKALRLFYKSNVPLYEWLQSPVVYEEDPGFADELRKLRTGYFSRRAGCHHYLSIATNTYHADLKGEKVPIKSYLYALRPLLACLWIIEKEEPPPMDIGSLRELIPDVQGQQAIDELIAKVATHPADTMIDPIPLLDHFISGTLKYCQEQCADIRTAQLPLSKLDELFRSYVSGELHEDKR